MKNILLILLFTLTAHTAHAYEIMYNFKKFSQYTNPLSPEARQALIAKHGSEEAAQEAYIWSFLKDMTGGYIAAKACKVDVIRRCEKLTAPLRETFSTKYEQLKTREMTDVTGMFDIISAPSNPQSKQDLSPKYIMQCLQEKQDELSTICDFALKKTIGVTLKEEAVIEGIALPKDVELIYATTNKVKGAVMPDDFTHDDMQFQKGTIYFSNGTITRGRLRQNTTLQAVPLKANERTRFYDNGYLQEGVLSENTIYQGIRFKQNTLIGFYDNRHMQYGTIAEDIVIQNVSYKAGTHLNFTEEGHVQKKRTHETTQEK